MLQTQIPEEPKKLLWTFCRLRESLECREKPGTSIAEASCALNAWCFPTEEMVQSKPEYLNDNVCSASSLSYYKFCGSVVFLLRGLTLGSTGLSDIICSLWCGLSFFSCLLACFFPQFILHSYGSYRRKLENKDQTDLVYKPEAE